MSPSIGEALRDFGTPIATAIAVINGLLALLIAQVLKERPRTRTVIVLIAVLLSGISIYATLAGQASIVEQRHADAEHRLKVRDDLGTYISDGNKLLMQVVQPKQPIQEAVILAWIERVHAGLKKDLGASFVDRFEDPSDVPSVSASSVDPANMLDPVHQNVFFAIHFRIVRLQQFSQQLPL